MAVLWPSATLPPWRRRSGGRPWQLWEDGEGVFCRGWRLGEDGSRSAVLVVLPFSRTRRARA